MGLGAGDRDALRIYRHCKDAVALGEGMRHQRHHCRHIDFQRVDAQVSLAGMPGQPLGQGLKARAFGRDALQGMLVAGCCRNFLRRLRRKQDRLPAATDSLMVVDLLGRYEGVKAGHALNNKLVRALLAQPDAWRETTRVPDMAMAG